MSLLIGVYVPTGIVISADSRTTGTISQQIPNPQNPTTQLTVQTNIVLSDAAQKLFLIDGRFGVGTFGDAVVNNMPIAHYIDEFVASPGRVPAATTQSLADDLLRYFRSLQPMPGSGFIVSGYDGNDPWVVAIDVRGNSAARKNVGTQPNELQYGIIRGGDTAVVDRILSRPEFNPPFQAMNLQDAVDYSRHLIRATIDQMRFEPRFPTVGGSIDTVVATRDGAHFLARKELTIS